MKMCIMSRRIRHLKIYSGIKCNNLQESHSNERKVTEKINEKWGIAGRVRKAEERENIGS